MKKIFEITDKKLITEMLNQTEYGVLALCDTQPYAVPLNFVYFEDSIYFHGSKGGKKMEILKNNNRVSFNVVSDSIIIPSYFSSKENLACPASTFFRSIIIDGEAVVVESPEEVAKMFSAMMEKLQPEGRYQSFDSKEYDKSFNALSLVKIITHQLSAKFKLAQNVTPQRFQMIIEHLDQRGGKLDQLTAKSMKQFYNK